MRQTTVPIVAFRLLIFQHYQSGRQKKMLVLYSMFRQSMDMLNVNISPSIFDSQSK